MGQAKAESDLSAGNSCGAGGPGSAGRRRGSSPGLTFKNAIYGSRSSYAFSSQSSALCFSPTAK